MTGNEKGIIIFEFFSMAYGSKTETLPMLTVTL